MNEQQEPQTFKPIIGATKTSKKKAVLLTLLVIVLVAGSGGGAYYWQHNQYTKTNKKLTNANAQITSLQSRLSSLQSKYNKDQATIQSESSSSTSTKTTPATQSDLTVTINGAEYVNPDGTVTANSSWFGVNATFVNNTSSTISISDSSFTLKDTSGNQYSQETVAGSTTLPSGWVALSNTTVAPSSTVKGTVVFQMPNTTAKSFTFTNDTKSYSVTSAN
jgi:hypothetical protein